MLTTSRAWQIVQQNSKFVATNILTGRCISLAHHIGKLLAFCETGKETKDIASYLKNYIPSTTIDATVSTLLRKKLLISEEDDVFTDTIPVHPSLWGCSRSVNPKTRIVILGAPFGLGNAVDIRCKDFPTHLRNYAWNYYSFKKLINNLNYLDFSEIAPQFNLLNYKKLISNNSISDIGDILFYCGETSKIFYARLEKITKEIINNEQIPICIGGDHSITFPIVAAFNERNVPFAVLHFDAHADMKDGMVMRLHEQNGNKIVNHANVIKQIIEFDNVAHVFQFGVREPFRYNNSKITRISIHDIKENNAAKVLKEVNLPIYITFDIDYFDPLIAPGTASTLPNGGDFEHTFDLLSQILKHKQVIGMDVVEANESLDIQNRTTLLVNHLLMHIISNIEL